MLPCCALCTASVEGCHHSGFLYVQERLKQQKEEAKTNPDYDKSFKGQLSKEEKKAKRKQILSNIGASALASAFLPLYGSILGACLHTH